MATEGSAIMQPHNGDNGQLHMEDDGDPPQLPIIVPNSVQGNVVTSEPMNGDIPAVVSITRVPAKAKQQEVPSGGGLKVRTDLGVPTPKPGPPPLLRVAGGPGARPALPPMPKLKLGGQRSTAPVGLRFQPPMKGTPMNGMLNMAKPPQSATSGGSMPIITNSMSLRQLRPKPPMQVPSISPRYGGPTLTRPPTPRQMATFIPQNQSPAQTSVPPSTRPVQVRTVFVPPPMKMKSPAPGPGPISPSSNGSTGPKVISSFNLNVPGSIPLATGISITPVSKTNVTGKNSASAKMAHGKLANVKMAYGKLASTNIANRKITNGKIANGSITDLKMAKWQMGRFQHAPIIKGVDVVNGESQNKVGDEEFDDIELDDEDEEEEPEVSDKNANNMTLKNCESSDSPIITKVTSLKKDDSSSSISSVDLSNQKAKKSFKNPTSSESVSITISPKFPDKTKTQSNEVVITPKRPLENESSNLDVAKKLKLDSTNVLSIPKPIAPKPAVAVKKPMPSLTPTHEILSSSHQTKQNCFCESEPIKDPSLEAEYICQAIENIGGHRVGCKNKVTRIELVKLTARDTAVLCDLHRGRLATHGCCPLCGEFCSHGLVFMCRASKTTSPHLFHRNCYSLVARENRMCPHCGSRRPPIAVQLKMSMNRTPLRLLSYTAKMCLTKKPDTEPWEVQKARENMIHYTLPNGKIISADGMPKGLEPAKLEEILKNFSSKTAAKVTTRDMYKPTAAGDNVKLLQLLALDYSPRQKFSEIDGGTPLHVAAANNHPLTAHILLQAGADINAFDDNNETPLMIAAYNGFPNIVRYLITAGAKVELKSDDGMTALHLAAQNGHLECSHIILGANKLPRNHINVKDDGGWTPLVWACEHKHEGVIRYLIDQGADPFTTDVEMNVALHWAAFSGSKDIVELLLAAGSNVNQANAIGETPLHIALRQDHYDCALFLITRGSRLDVVNNQGQLPAHCIDEDKSKAAGLIQLGTTLQKLMQERKAKFLTERTVSIDISNGKETIPITAINGEDFENGPSGYVYVKNNVITQPLPIDRNIAKLQHCKCKDNCASEETCKCSDISLRSWYDNNSVLKEGFDFKDPPMIFECNDMCACNINSCNNRVVQHGITARMQVYKTYGMGWGVKSLVDIPKGGFVCEYVGELISDAEAEQRENDSYLFDLENRDGDTFCIDANKFGNVTRLINHSCDPNLVPVKVFTSHQDLRFPHIAMFASRDIKKGDVLGFDYGEKFWVIKHKFFTCWCGLEKCRYSKTAIGRTLDNYYKKNDLLKSPEEEKKKQTGRLKLKLKMEEGKVVKVNDSVLIPDKSQKKREERKSSDERDKSKEKETGQESKKIKKAMNGVLKDEAESCDSDSSKKSDRSNKKVDKISIISLKEKITEIQGQIMEIENKKVDKNTKVKEKSVETTNTIIVEEETKSIEEEIIKTPPPTSEVIQDELAEESIEKLHVAVENEVAAEVTDLVVSEAIKCASEMESVKKEEDTIVETNKEMTEETIVETNEEMMEKTIPESNGTEETVKETKESEPKISSPSVRRNQCSKCLIIINKPVKLRKHSRLCKGKGNKNQLLPNDKLDKSRTEKHEGKIEENGNNSAKTEENSVIHCNNGEVEEREIKSVKVEELNNGEDSVSSVTESSDETPKRKAGRPKKPMVDVNNILDKMPQTSPYPKRSSSTSLRSSTTTPTPTSEPSKPNNSETEESSGRPKRSRKTVDKDL